MDNDNAEWLWVGLVWGIAITILLIRYEMWLRRTPDPEPVDPFDTLRWEVLHSAREVIDGEVVNDATR